MIIDCIADLHGFFPTLKGGDLLIVAGDLTAADIEIEYFNFFDWLNGQKYRKKIVIAGNHDMRMQEEKYKGPKGAGKDSFTYLCDSATEFEGLKIWGSPWSLWFKGINPKCSAFTGSENDLKKKYDLIPDDIDILISHCPMKFYLDTNKDGLSCGSESLRQAVDRIKPQLLVCGHIHEQGGAQKIFGNSYSRQTHVINASVMDENYDSVDRVTRIIL